MLFKELIEGLFECVYNSFIYYYILKNVVQRVD